MSRWYLILGEIVFVSLILAVAWILFRQHVPIANAVHAGITLSDDSRAQVYLQKDSAGQLQYYVWHPGGSTDKISGDALAQRLYVSGSSGGGLAYLGANSATVLLWLGLGLLGQLLFTGRMIVQWIASERKGTSVVPPMFWWMSLIGSLLLLSYFLWRRDPIGLLGQAFGSFIYLRNIIWIMEGKRLGPAAAAEDGDTVVQS